MASMFHSPEPGPRLYGTLRPNPSNTLLIFVEAFASREGGWQQRRQVRLCNSVFLLSPETGQTSRTCAFASSPFNTLTLYFVKSLIFRRKAATESGGPGPYGPCVTLLSRPTSICAQSPSNTLLIVNRRLVRREAVTKKEDRFPGRVKQWCNLPQTRPAVRNLRSNLE